MPSPCAINLKYLQFLNPPAAAYWAHEYYNVGISFDSCWPGWLIILVSVLLTLCGWIPGVIFAHFWVRKISHTAQDREYRDTTFYYCCGCDNEDATNSYSPM